MASVAVFGPAGHSTAEGLASSRSDDLIPLIDRALADAGIPLGELAAIAVGAGPGSFTGLRIGMATAKGLCFAAGLPLWPVSSLAALALDAAAVDPLTGAMVLSLLDARRGEVCAGFFRVTGDRAESLADERIVAPSALAAVIAEVRGREPGLTRALVVGDAIEAHASALASIGELLAHARLTPSATSVARLALAGPRADALRTGTPVYIRPSAAEVTFPAGNPGSRFTTAAPEKK